MAGGQGTSASGAPAGAAARPAASATSAAACAASLSKSAWRTPSLVRRSRLGQLLSRGTSTLRVRGRLDGETGMRGVL